MTLDLVLDKFKAAGCPFLKHVDAISSQELIYGVVFRLHNCLNILTSPKSSPALNPKIQSQQEI